MFVWRLFDDTLCCKECYKPELMKASSYIPVTEQRLLMQMLKVVGNFHFTAELQDYLFMEWLIEKSLVCFK